MKQRWLTFGVFAAFSLLGVWLLVAVDHSTGTRIEGIVELAVFVFFVAFSWSVRRGARRVIDQYDENHRAAAVL
jgi:hypothetical protein